MSGPNVALQGDGIRSPPSSPATAERPLTDGLAVPLLEAHDRDRDVQDRPEGHAGGDGGEGGLELEGVGQNAAGKREQRPAAAAVRRSGSRRRRPRGRPRASWDGLDWKGS